jgi:hypothetical protein
VARAAPLPSHGGRRRTFLPQRSVVSLPSQQHGAFCFGTASSATRATTATGFTSSSTPSGAATSPPKSGDEAARRPLIQSRLTECGSNDDLPLGSRGTTRASELDVYSCEWSAPIGKAGRRNYSESSGTDVHSCERSYSSGKLFGDRQNKSCRPRPLLVRTRLLRPPGRLACMQQSSRACKLLGDSY